jgi:hypothetical protein
MVFGAFNEHSQKAKYLCKSLCKSGDCTAIHPCFFWESVRINQDFYSVQAAGDENNTELEEASFFETMFRNNGPPELKKIAKTFTR